MSMDEAEIDALYERVMDQARIDVVALLTRSDVAPSRYERELLEVGLQCGVNAAVHGILAAQEAAR